MFLMAELRIPDRGFNLRWSSSPPCLLPPPLALVQQCFVEIQYKIDQSQRYLPCGRGLAVNIDSETRLETRIAWAIIYFRFSGQCGSLSALHVVIFVLPHRIRNPVAVGQPVTQNPWSEQRFQK